MNPHSSLIITPNQRKINVEQKYTYGARAGVKFIELEHTAIPFNSPRDVGGFQAVTVSRAIVRNRQEIVQRPSKDSENNDCAKGYLVFLQDEFDTGHAWLPDTPFNRNKLAAAMAANNALWRIVNPDIEAEIRQMAENRAKDPIVLQKLDEIKRRVKEEEERIEQLRRQSESPQERAVREELAAVNSALQTIASNSQMQELRERLRKAEDALAKAKGVGAKPLKPESGIASVRPQSMTTTAPGVVADVVDTDIPDAPEEVRHQKDKRYKELRAKITEEVRQENKALCEKLKAQKPKGWHFHSEYRRVIEPEINKRLEEALNADGDGVHQSD